MRQDNSGKWYESGCHFRGYGPCQTVYAPPIAAVNVPALRQSDDHCLHEATFFVVNMTYLPLAEEPGLARRFCDYYPRYKGNVPRWKPWSGPKNGNAHDLLVQ
jgi:hypothetical protein